MKGSFNFGLETKEKRFIKEIAFATLANKFLLSRANLWKEFGETLFFKFYCVKV